MPARPIGSATISFGLVSVPVKLYSASESQASVSFNWLHKACGSRLKQQYICSKDGEVVQKDDMVKGYEFAKGQYVLFAPEELKALEEQASESIDIAEFVPGDEVDRIYFEKVYYLGPDKGGDRAYRLLSEAMKATGLSALARYAARGKQYLVLVRPMENGLVLEQLRYADEIKSFAEVPLGEGSVKKEELKLAVQLIKQAASNSFRPEAYEDDVRKRILEQIQRKIDGQEITQAPEAPAETQIIDLMEALKASLTKGGLAKAESKKPAKRSARPAAAGTKSAKRKAASS